MRTLWTVAVGALGLMLMAWLVMLWAILPRIDTWRAPIEHAATQTLGVPVQIGHIRAQSHAGMPWFEFTDVRLLDADGREALRLPQVRSTLSWSTVWHARLRLGRLELQSPELEVRRDPAGRLHVAGLGLTSGGTSASPEALDWFISLPEFLVHDGRVRWVDEQRGLPPLALDDVDGVMRNSGAGARRHEFRLDATPVAGWGERFSLRARFTQPLLTRASDRSQWSGQAYAELPRVQLRALQDHLGWPTRLDGGEGSVRAWADLHEGRWQGLTADLDLAGVAGRLDGAPEALDLAALRLRVVYQHEGEQHRLAVQELSVLPRADADPSQALLSAGLPRALHVGWRWETLADGTSSLTSGEVQVPQGDLAAVAWLARSLPLGEAAQHGMAQLQPAGEVEGLRLQWHGPWQAPDRYTARGRLKGLSLAAQGDAGTGVGRPGLRGATLDFTAHERGGEAMLRIEEGAVVFPGVFDEAEVALDQLQARLDWTLTPDPSGPSVMLKVSEARFSNADAQGTFEGRWHTGADEGVGRGARLPGVLDLQGRLDRADATRVWRYLPRQLPADVRDYIRHAVMAGRAEAVDFRLRGDLWDFPYAPGQPGEFRIAAQVEDASFAYVPTRAGWTSPWPAFTHVRGELVFDRQSMLIRNARARLFGFELTGVEGGIADLAHHSVLRLSGSGTGPLADALRFINDTPVGDWTHHALAEATGSGSAQLRLSVELPLDDMDRARVQGRVILDGNDVRVRPDTPLLARTRGEVSFSDQGFAVQRATARVLGGELHFEGGTVPDGSVRFEGRGIATAEGLRQVRELGPLPYLAEHLSGQTAYRLQFGVAHGWPELTLSSDLTGLASALPEPLGKPAARAWPLRVALALEADSLAPGRSPRDTLRVQLGQELWLHYRRALGESGATRVLAGAIGVGETLPLPSAGVRARVVLPQVDLDRWRAVASSFEAGLGAGEAVSGGYAPDRVELRSPQVQLAGRSFQGVRVQGERAGDGWRGSLRADQLEGRVEWQPGATGAGGGKLLARLSRLNLPAGHAEATEALWQSEVRRPAPALDIEVDDLRWGDKRLGRVEVQAASRLTGEFHEWRLQHLRVIGPQARLQASGSWLAVRGGVAGATPRTELDFELDVADSGALLSQWGQSGVVAGGKGRVTGRIGWQGSPLSPEVAGLSGQMRVDVERGRFLKADPGAARLASVLSLQALPRRLMLDFSDVFREGFVFDDFGGDVRITNGVARTENLRMRGVAAAVLMEGQADLQHETQDLRVVVVPEINAGGASLVYAAINPAVGLGTFLAQLFLRKPMIEANTREFHVTGSWADPQVDPVPRQSAAPPRPAGG